MMQAGTGALKPFKRGGRKLTEKSGVSVGEMLLAVLIMSLLTLVVAAGSGTVMKVYRSEKAYSESRVLANSLLTAITEEIRYASGVDADGEGTSHEVVYNSSRYGAGARLHIVEENGKSYGKLAVSYPGAGGSFGSGGAVEETIYLYDDATYAGYRIMPPSSGEPMFSYDETKGCVEVSFEICDKNGEVQASVEHVRIRLLNS